jgi:adenine-specific DNA methylase
MNINDLAINSNDNDPKQLHLFSEKDYLTLPNIRTIEYLGSKRSILNKIVPAISEVIPKGKVVLDLFSGSGAVAFALQPNYIVYANDIQRYSFEISKALLYPCPEFSNRYLYNCVLNDFEKNLNSTKEYWKEAIEVEDAFFLQKPSKEIVEKYRLWCESTPFWGSTIIQDTSFKSTKSIINEISLNEYQKNHSTFPYVLFATYFMNGYFGVRQSLEIDSIRYAIDKIPDHQLKSILLAALMSSMSACVSSTTHFAQFLKIRTMNSLINTLEKRKKSIWSLFLSRLAELLKFHYQLEDKQIILPYRSWNTCFNKSFEELLNDLSIGDIDCIYADPPYFKEHYSRYYHVLETLVNYDYPPMTFNKRTNRITDGRYREDRYTSEFGKKSTAPKAFEKIASRAKTINAKLITSYSNSSIVDLDTVISIYKKYYSTVYVQEIPHQHSKQGRQELSTVIEYLIISR